jgi:hypothetical protein
VVGSWPHWARAHWTKWLPQRVTDLRASGQLNEALHGAARLAQNEIELLMKQGYQEQEAREVALPMFILLPPEPGADEEDWERLELAEKEAEYRRNPPPSVAADRERDREDFSDLEAEYRRRE